MMEGTLLLSLSPDLRIDQITPTATGLRVHLVSTQLAARCPLCGQASESVHSRYRRVVADAPCGLKPISLSLEVRKFFCRTPTCPRKIFTERLPDLVQPWARMTKRLRAALQALGMVTGGEGGAGLAPKLGMRVASPTLLRGMREVASPAVTKVRVVGVDDWAYKRGETYGTIVVDLERHRVVDLLPDRRSETVKVWLQGHPEIEVMSRDRAGSYAEAARQGAPQATQVADRFHLTKNVREKLKDLLDRKRTCLPFVEESTVHSACATLPASPQKESADEHEKQTAPVNKAVLNQPDDGASARPLTAPEWRRQLN